MPRRLRAALPLALPVALPVALVLGLLACTPAVATAAGEAPGAAVTLRTYRLALASDPSYAAAVAPGATTKADSDAQVLAAKQAVVDRLNQVYGDELAIRFVLAPGTSGLNFRNAAEATTANGPCGTEPCFTADQLAGGCSDDLMHRTRYVIGQLLGAHGYEIGQVLLGTAAGSSSFQWSAGTEYRAFGCAGSTTPTGDGFVVDLVAHELGHQLGAGATFDGLSCTEERNVDSAAEPGSGSSVMGRPGTCGTDDLQAHADPWFSSTSLDEIGLYVTGDSGVVPDDAVAAEVQSVALTGFDGVDSFKLSFNGVQTPPITRGTNYSQDGIKAAVLSVVGSVPTAVASKVRPFWQTGSFDDRGFEITFGTYENVPEPTVVPVVGTFTAQVNDIDAGGLQKIGGTTSASGNKSPVVTAPADRTIPVRTPFALTGSATDPDADPLVYQWQQTDLGGADGLGLTDPAKTDGPLFRLLPPVAGPTRVFPDLAQVVAGNTNASTGTCAAGSSAVDCYSEWLPTPAYTPLTMHFSLVARDRDAGGGGTASDEVVLTVDKATGPFLVTSHGAPATVTGGTDLPVTWTANTAALAANVKISLSTDGGQTFPTVLAASTPNDGSQTVSLPEVAATVARIKVEAVGNYFFDISDADLTITVPPAGLTVTGVPASASTQYSDPVGFAFTAESESVPADAITASMTGLPSGLTLTKTAPGSWSVTGTALGAPGPYAVHLDVADGTTTKSFDRTMTVTRESSTVVYDGVTAEAVEEGGPDAVDLELSATVTEVADGTPADITTATVTFTDQTTGEVLCADVPVVGDGTANCTATADLPEYGGRTFQVVPSVDGRWTAPVVAPTPVVVTAPGPPNPTPPDTSITLAPPAWVLGTSTAVSFSSSEEGSTFKCKLDGAGLPCAGSPLTLSGLSVGSHRFTVAARDAEGTLDESPAATTFTVPVDDRVLTIGSGRWKFRSAPAAYRGTYAKVSAKNAVLTYRVTGVRSLALVVGTAAEQGRVKVFLDGTLLGRVRLTGPTAWAKLVPVATFATPRSGVVRIVSRSNRQLRIDGLGAATL